MDKHTRICNKKYNLINAAVAATGFFAGEVEIYDFVTERAKRCIAAKKENGWENILENLQ